MFVIGDDTRQTLKLPPYHLDIGAHLQLVCIADIHLLHRFSETPDT